MALDLYSIEYLKAGSNRQRRAFEALSTLGLFAKLEEWTDGEIFLGGGAVLAGSVPIDLATDESDLDIVTYSEDIKGFSAMLRSHLAEHEGFNSSRGIFLGVPTLVTEFYFGGEQFEIFTQSVPVPRQNAVIHLLIEERLLEIGGAEFRQAVWNQRKAGLKTEPAFGAVLGLEDPYRELLNLEDLTDNELRLRFAHRLNSGS